MSKTLFILLGIILTGFVSCTSKPCKAKDYGNRKIVCVCDENYCDTLPPLEKIQPQYFKTYVSNKNGLRFEESSGSFQNKSENAEVTININSEEKFQEILGWGGALHDSAAINIKSLNEKASENLMRSYFSEEGLEYSLVRIPIGSTDFSTHPYSYDDGEKDADLLNFALAPEDHTLKIPLALRIKELTQDKVKFFASTWTSPKWMKTNNDYYGFGFLKEEAYQSWANYFIKFLDAYKEEGIDFWGITTQNEPILGFLPQFLNKIISIGWTHWQMSTWISEYLGPTIRNSEYSNLKIMCLDDQRFFLPWFIDLLFENNITKQFIDGIAYHWYWNDLAPPEVLSITHEKYPEKFILSTEACVILHGKPIDFGSWETGEAYFNDILENIENWVSGWVDWGIAEDTQGGPTYIDNFVDSPVIVNATAGEFYKQPSFYALGHFSKFVPYGSYRIGSSVTGSSVKSVAFRRPDGGIVVSVLNRNDKDVTLKVQDKNRGEITLNITKRSFNTIVYW